jgi:hypothetical protein
MDDLKLKSLKRKSDQVSSQNSLKTLEPINPPLNNYKDFASVFNAKGMLGGSRSRKNAKMLSENQSLKSDMQRQINQEEVPVSQSAKNSPTN